MTELCKVVEKVWWDAAKGQLRISVRTLGHEGGRLVVSAAVEEVVTQAHECRTDPQHAVEMYRKAIGKDGDQVRRED